MIEFPWHCRVCGHEQMVDMERLDTWVIDKLTSARGYTCEKCGSREAISYVTLSLQEAFRRLLGMGPRHKKYPYYFARAVRKAEGINKRGSNGACGHSNLASPG